MLARAMGLITGDAKGEPVTCFSAPLLSMENTEMLLVSRLATNSKVPEVSIATYEGLVPGKTENGEPLNAVSVPELSKENAETSFEPWLAVKRKFPVGCTRTLTGVIPVASCAPTAESWPVLPMLNAATVLVTESATNRNLPVESMAIATGLVPAAIVDAGGFCKHPGPVGQRATTGVEDPAELNMYVAIEPVPASVMATNSMLPVVASALGAPAVGSGQGTIWFGVQLSGGGGNCLTSVNVPPTWSMRNPEMLFDPLLATNTKKPLPSMAMAAGFTPVGTGVETGAVPLVDEKVAIVRMPVDRASTYCE